MPIISVTNLHKQFGPLEVLKGISFTVNVGETVVFAGPSGSGKSTLLRCLNGLEKIQSGQINMDGIMVHKPDTDMIDLRRRIGMVFQSFNLFPHLTILENITIPLTKVRRMGPEASKDLAVSLLAKVGIEDKVNVYPGRLSGGQQQRAAIARALAMEPKVMLFDEPTSALDPELTGGVIEILKDLSRSKMTMLVVTHEMNFARHAADRMVFMDGGHIIEENAPEELINHPVHERTQQFMTQIAYD